MEILRCHSNQSSYPPGIKNTNYVEATVRNMYKKYRLHPLDSFWEEDFLNVFPNFALYGAPATNQNEGLGQKSHET